MLLVKWLNEIKRHEIFSVDKKFSSLKRFSCLEKNDLNRKSYEEKVQSNVEGGGKSCLPRHNG